MLSEEEKKAAVKKAEDLAPTNWKRVFLLTFLVVLAAVLLVLSLPWLIFRYYHFRAMRPVAGPQSAYWRFMASTFYLNQMGVEMNELTATQFARQVIDPRFGTDAYAFMQVYQKAKYSREPLTPREEKVVNAYYPEIINKVRQKLPFKYRLGHFLQPGRTVYFYAKATV